MEFAEVAPSSGSPEAGRPDGCPRCGEAWAKGPGVTAPSFGGRILRRCTRCGTRAATGTGTSSLLFTCEGCGLPFLADALLPHADHRCPACAAGQMPPELPDAQVAAAAENEVRAALASRWRFLTSPTAQPYIDRIARQVASRIASAPSSPRVVLVEAAEHRTLALPSGLLLMSTGLLTFLEDEAELVFVLGHEIAHAASGEAAVRLVRLGFQATARERGAADGLCWSDAAVDLARLGYGRKRERDADACALAAMIELDYDAQSACRYLRRLHGAIGRGDPSVAETAIAHPTPFERVRRIERALGARVGPALDVPRVNREVFRRALAPPILAASLTRVRLDVPPASPWGVTAMLDIRPKRLTRRVVLAVTAVLAALAGLILWWAR